MRYFARCPLVPLAAVLATFACGDGGEPSTPDAGGERADSSVEQDSGAADSGTTDSGADVAGNAAPSVELLAPAAALRIAVGEVVDIAYRDDDPDDEARTDILADVDGDLATEGDQIAIASARPEQGGAEQHVAWDTRTATAATYALFARTNDGSNAPVVARAAGEVTLVATRLRVENVEPGETLRYDLALVSGTLRPDLTSIHVARAGSGRDWPVIGGRWKALVLLAPGDNDLELGADGITTTFRLSYRPQDNRRFVRFVYLVAADGDGRFDAPAGEPNDVASAVERLRLGARLMQTFTAEKLRSEGLGRHTFNLARDASGEPIVEVVTSSITLAYARTQDGNALWSRFYGELGALPARDDSIDVVVMSMTHYDAGLGQVYAHTALGGGRLGLFGSATLHTWAPSLDELGARFTDPRDMDALLFDDSAFRATYWANYATGLGATLHELGHCLSLPHPANGVGIMSRQFDFINRTFVAVEPPSHVSAGLSPITPADETGWDRSAAVRLAYHRWLALDDRVDRSTEAPAFEVSGDALTIRSTIGLRQVNYQVNGDGAGHEEFLAAPETAFTVPLATLRGRFPGATAIHVSAIDDDGLIGDADLGL